MVGWGVEQQHHGLHDQHHQQEQQQGWRKGPWAPEEDRLLTEYVAFHGEGRWSSVAKCAGLNRSGKSCRLRWVNYLRPGLKKGHITSQEEGVIIELHSLWGNKWSTIARFLPGRTDNEIKNYWRTHFKKRNKSLSKQDKMTERSQNQKLQQHQQAPKHEPQPQPQPQPQLHPQTQTHHMDDMKIIKDDDQDIACLYPSKIIAATTTATATPTAELDDQYHMPHSDAVEPYSSDQSMVDEGFLWGSLWNLDDENPHDVWGL